MEGGRLRACDRVSRPERDQTRAMNSIWRTIALLAAIPVLSATKPAPAPLPTAIASPEPAAPFVRMQPRRVTASSWLQNGWNQFEQNYLPPYVADDDPATAWVEGVQGNGEGEHVDWFGPKVEGSHAVKVFLRNGFQKSSKLYLANGRAKRVSIAALKSDGDKLVAVAPVESDLREATGWQEVDLVLPDGAVGIRITLLAVTPGATYSDTCLSDVRVYMDAGPKYRPEVEATFAEGIRKFVAERQAAAKAGAAKAHVQLMPAYVQVESSVVALTLAETRGTLETMFTRAAGRLEPSAGSDARVASAAKLLSTYAWLASLATTTPDGWHDAKVTPLIGARTGEVALQAIVGDRVPGVDRSALLAPYFHAADFAAFDDSRGAREKALETLRQISSSDWHAWLLRRDRESVPSDAEIRAQCAMPCIKTVEPMASELRAAWSDAGLHESVADACAEDCARWDGDPPFDFDSWLRMLAARRTIVKGPNVAPVMLYREVGEIFGDRELVQSLERSLIAYDGGVAVGVVMASDSEEMSPQNTVVRLFEWKRDSEAARPRLVKITTFTIDPGARLLRYSVFGPRPA
jgi:hypothetical protein